MDAKRNLLGEDWYRNKDWNSTIETKFEKNLSRARTQRPQYLYIQAVSLIDRHPDISLVLLERYSDEGDEFHMAAALSCRGDAHSRIGNLESAVESYKLAIELETKKRVCRTTAKLKLLQLVAENELSHEYEYIHHIANNSFGDLDFLFANSHYIWNGAVAILMDSENKTEEASRYARAALSAREETRSAFRYHPKVGLVRIRDDKFFFMIQEIARKS